MAISINGKCHMEGFTNSVKVTNPQSRSDCISMKDMDFNLAILRASNKDIV